MKRVVGVVLTLLVTRSLTASAQTIGGMVVEQGTQRPLDHIVVVAGDSGAIVRGLTDAHGTFMLDLPHAGTFMFRVGEGPERMVFDKVVVSADSFVQRTFVIPPRRVYGPSEVTKEATALPGAEINYPKSLRDAGVEGTVVVSFPVDDRGKAVRDSLEVIETSHQQFADAVRAALPSLRFSSAQRDGVDVSQLMELTVSFSIGKCCPAQVGKNTIAIIATGETRTVPMPAARARRP